jgi:hypothetical protein
LYEYTSIRGWGLLCGCASSFGMGFKQTTTVSSDGLSASLLETPNDFIGDEVRTMDFFLDVNLLYDLIGVSLEEANSHLVMFEITGEDFPHV